MGSGGGQSGSGGAAVALTPCPASSDGGWPGGLCPAGQQCCAVAGAFPNESKGCHPVGTCPVGSFSVACDGPEDCAAGELCCGTHSTAYSSIVCQATCDGANEYVMCGGNDASLCPVGQACNVSDSLPGYYYCG
jgi:hypothetical protein